MEEYKNIGNIQVDSTLYDFIENEAILNSGVSSEAFWAGLDEIIHNLSPKNKELLSKREELQKSITDWYTNNKTYDQQKYKSFLKEINYIEPEVEDFEIDTKNIDDEIAIKPGPQLVVPVSNARYAVNAANARWGSLYDALYGSDVISEDDGAEAGNGYNPIRGEKVFAYTKQILNKIFPLTENSHKEVQEYKVENGQLVIILNGGTSTSLKMEDQFVGYNGLPEKPSAILLKNNGLHVEIQIDRNDSIGKNDTAGVKDIVVESAITTIMDFEDSVAAVDAEDKVHVYRNYLGLLKGDISVSFKKGSKTITRTLNPDRLYTAPNGSELSLSGRSLMFVRNVGHLMTSDAVLDKNGQEVPEGILDAVVTGLIAKQDVLKNGKYQNSTKGSVYIVKPKMHGPKEVAFANELFNQVEDLFDYSRNTLKIGVMDEERRTSLNLKACIKEVKNRVAFINTGFLDRTGDEIHTSMVTGPVIRKGDMKNSTWFTSYEKSNVKNGLESDFSGKAQIGKGMWAMPELMAQMLKTKDGQLKAGANTAWVPSPTAATLHALHYLDIDVLTIQEEMGKDLPDYLDDMLQVPTVPNTDWTPEEIQEELDNNAQSILGYVVRWIQQGIGCSKVPNISNIELMEDRATLRISSQHITNWLYHGVVSEDQVLETFKRMAKLVDKQNQHDPNYRAMANDFDNSIAFQASCELVFEGVNQPNGYTEPILHRRRKEAKTKAHVN
ncbi:malate synthase G [Bacillus carboniphilus]|uniref:Malate synthase G n=1 Tax=Bacillus carboniphilus TaxID=86663 RepID=A0ABY9JS08_9BACI|nr:malate synthase G [Bacillus carboniphilus]WLR42190.1 malate synthase G [Bacillus carboniphilus]